MYSLNSSRRSFMKWVAAAPLLSQIAVSDLYAKAASAVAKDPRQNVYRPLWGKDRHQLPRNVDLPQWLSGVS